MALNDWLRCVEREYSILYQIERDNRKKIISENDKIIKQATDAYKGRIKQLRNSSNTSGDTIPTFFPYSMMTVHYASNKTNVTTGQKFKYKLNAHVMPHILEQPWSTCWSSTQKNFYVDDENFDNVPYLGDLTENSTGSEYLKLIIDDYNLNFGFQSSKRQYELDQELLVKVVRNLTCNTPPILNTNNNIITQHCGANENNENNNLSMVVHQGPPQNRMMIDNLADRNVNLGQDMMFEALACYRRQLRGYHESGRQLKEDYYKIIGERREREPRPNVDDPQLVAPIARQVSLQTYMKRFCRRCYLYNCYLHPESSMSSSVIQCRESMPLGTSTPNSEYQDMTGEWSPWELTIARVLDPIMSFDDIAEALGASKSAKDVENLLDFENIDLVNLDKPHSRNVSRRRRLNTRLTHPKRRHVGPDIHKFTGPIRPCDHGIGPCDPRTCSCIQANSTCEKFCLCNENCRNRFAGCKCEGPCNTDSCRCHKSQRECDPDLCSNCRPQQHDICKNMNVLLGKRKHVKMGSSQVHGWGLFTVRAIKKDDYIGEYSGELLTHAEAERRGRIYNVTGYSWQFYLNHQYTVDAKRKGNKMRFMNHSSDCSNVVPKILYVSGDHRIAMFAKRDIEAHEELLLDYQYDPNAHLNLVRLF